MGMRRSVRLARITLCARMTTDNEAQVHGEAWLKAGGPWFDGALLNNGDRVKCATRAEEGWILELDDGNTLTNCQEGYEDWVFAGYDVAQERAWVTPGAPAPWPDFRDGPTRGGALDAVRAAWGGTVWIGGNLVNGRLAWWVCGLHVSDSARVNGGGFATEAEALIGAFAGAAPRA